MKTTQFFIEESSPFDFDQTVEKIISEAEKNHWNVPFIRDMQKSMSKSGIHVKPVKVIEICKPEYSGNMLQLNDERIMSTLMPCRISVYEKNDGKTYIAVVNPGMMSSEMPDNIAHTMKNASDDAIELIENIIGKHELSSVI